MQIQLMTISSLPNKIKKQQKQQSGTRYVTGNFRGDYDEEFPVIEILTQDVKENYVKIKDICYFISTVVYTSNQTAVLTLEMDYLSTFKDLINGTEFFVERYNKGTNVNGTKLTDKQDPMQPVAPDRETTIVDMGFADQSVRTNGSKNQRRILLTTITKPSATILETSLDYQVTDGVGYKSYLLTLKEAALFAKSVWETSWAEAFLKFFGKPYDGVLTFKLLPFTPNLPGAVFDQVPIRIGDQDAALGGVVGDKVFGSHIIGAYTTGVLQSDIIFVPYDPNLGFLNRAPYSTYEIHIPWHGFYSLDMKYFSEMNYERTASRYPLYIKYLTSMITGDTTVQICIGSSGGDSPGFRVIDEFPLNITFDLPFSTSSYFGPLSKLVGMGAIVGAALFTGGATAAAGASAGATTVATGVAAKTATSALSGMEDGGGLSVADNFKGQAKDLGLSASRGLGETLTGDQYQYGGYSRGTSNAYVPGLTSATPDTELSRIYLSITRPTRLDRSHTPYIGTKVNISADKIVDDLDGSFYQISGVKSTKAIYGSSNIAETRYFHKIMNILKGGIYI